MDLADHDIDDTTTAQASKLPRRYKPVIIVGALALAVIVGALIGLAIPRLDQPGDDSVEAGFLRDMATHHAQAVEMGVIAYAKAELPDVRTLGLDIALTQHGQVNIMHTWLRDWGLNPNGEQAPMQWMADGADAIQDGLMPGMATPDQLAGLRAATGRNVDIDFLTLMRQHHLGGIHMAQEILRLSDNKDILWIAQSMVANQQSELNAIADLLKILE